jgi:hypothetical protein
MLKLRIRRSCIEYLMTSGLNNSETIRVVFQAATIVDAVTMSELTAEYQEKLS